MKTALVTGGTGFTGQAMCQRLAAEGVAVTAFVRATSNTAPLEALGVRCPVVELADAADVDANFSNFDHVYHIAAAYRTEHADRGEFHRINVEATGHLLNAARKHQVGRFVHCSTVGVQGEIEEPPAAEDYRFAPGDHYQQSKLDGELLALEHFAQGLPGAVVRPVGIYGPGDTRFLKLFRMIDSGKFMMIGSGQTLYHLTFIDDLIDGFVLAGNHPNALGEVFTIAGERYTTLNELVAKIAGILGRPVPRLRIPLWPVLAASHVCETLCQAVNVAPPLYPRRVEFFKLDRAFSTEKAKKLMGYQAKVGLDEGLTRTAESYREAGLLSARVAA